MRMANPVARAGEIASTRVGSVRAMAHVDRIRRLLDLQGSHPVERALLDGEVLAYEPHRTGASGVNSVLYVELEPDLVAFHKPHDGIVPRIARDYGHSLDTPPVCECAAWQLARQWGIRSIGSWRSRSIGQPARQAQVPTPGSRAHWRSSLRVRR